MIEKQGIYAASAGCQTAQNTEIYAAPMEGLTGFAWRKAHREVFGAADKYFSPFVVANQTHKFKTKEIRDLTQNEENLVPQILTDKAEHFIWAARELQAMGYSEINLNAGCPSSTVVTHSKGSGMLQNIPALDAFLDRIFDALPDMQISIKTRVGFAYKEDWERIWDVYKKYPISELIIHPRLREEYYEGEADRKLFWETLAEIRETNSENVAPHNLKLVYNGDIWTADDAAFGYGCDVMLGRGLMRNPALIREAKLRLASVGDAKASDDNHEEAKLRLASARDAKASDDNHEEAKLRLASAGNAKVSGGEHPRAKFLMGAGDSGKATREELTQFHRLLIEYYSSYMDGDGPVIHHLKALWVYMSELFEYDEKTMKKLRKTKKMSEYKALAGEILRSSRIK